MAKVSNRALSKRWRGALYLLLLLIFGVIALTKCGGCDRDVTETEGSVTPATTSAAAESTAAETTEIAETSAAGTESETDAITFSVELPLEASIDVEPILQLPELPTGCEITTLTMALNFAGYAVDKLTMADEYLVCADPYTATFGEAFIGSPYDETAWGCYAPVIVKTAEAFLEANGGTETVLNLTGSTLEMLLWEVTDGTPVITWASIDMTDDIEEKYYWTTEDGKDAVFLVGEHCLLLCGYDLKEQTVLTCDPLVGLVEYDLAIFQDRFERMYSQAVVIHAAS